MVDVTSEHATRNHERRWWALAVLCMSLMIIAVDNTILNVALPALVRDLHASTSALQWIVDGYTLVLAGLLLMLGSVGDRFGRKGALMVGLVIFGIGSVLSAIAGSSTQLIFTRAFMGIGAALIMPATLSLLTNIFPDPRERARAIGAWAAVAGASGALGPVLGGLLLAHFSWGSVFLVNVPIIAVALVCGWRLLPSSRDLNAPRLDLVGAGLSIVGLVLVLWAIIDAPQKGWGDSQIMLSLLVGVFFLVVFILWELRSSHPMLDVRFFRNRRFSAASGALTLVFFALFGQMFLSIQYLQTVLGFSALESGMRMLPLALVMTVLAPVTPRIVERFGTKVVVGIGLLVVASGLALVATVPVSEGYVHLLTGFLLISTGMAMTMAPATESIMGSLPPAKAGVGSAMNDTTRLTGGALGVAILGSVFATFYRPGVADRLANVGLSADQLGRARDSIGGAVQVAGELAPARAARVVAVAKSEFVNGMHHAAIVALIITVLAAVVVFAFLPAQATDAKPTRLRTDAFLSELARPLIETVDAITEAPGGAIAAAEQAYAAERASAGQRASTVSP